MAHSTLWTKTPEIFEEHSEREIMQKIILIIEPSDNAYDTPAKIGNIFMNRFAIDEDASSEVLKIFELGKIFSWELTKGMDHLFMTKITQ